jgi:nicotinamidase-related amidase
MKQINIFLIAFLSVLTLRAQKVENPALATLTKDNTVFVYVDFLSGLDDYITTIPAKAFRNNITAFAKLNQVFPLPSAIMGDEGEYRGKFYPEITKYVTNNTKIFKRTTPTGYTKEFAEWVKKTGRKNIIIGGISIDNCTLHTGLDLIRNGYNVFVLVDVSGTNNKLAEDAALNRLSRAGAVLTTWISMSTELVKDWASADGKKLTEFVMMEHLAPSTIGTIEDPSADMNKK